MQDQSVERHLLTAAVAVERGVVTAEDLAMATARWRQNAQGTLLQYLEQLPHLNEEARQQLQSIFAEYQDSLVSSIAASIDDSVFGRLNGAFAEIGDDAMKASIVRWQNISATFSAESTSDGERFEIIAPHAEGGLGEVLLAEDRQLNREVALKRIREKWAGHEPAQVRFRLEAEITGRLEHPGVVPVYALGTRADGQVYYAMRFIRGQSLESTADQFHQSSSEDHDRFHTPEFRNLLRRFVDVCNTISYAHSRGIIHRDLKPANIMLGRYGETLVVDWGLAKNVTVQEETSDPDAGSLIQPQSGSGSAPTQFGSAVGTPQYMSPEQATGRLDRMSPLTDVYGLGATLYFVLTGQPPQPADSVERILERVEHGDYLKPTAAVADVPKPLEAVCLKAMAVRPLHRYSSSSELAADIEYWLADEPIEVHADPIHVRAARWVRKNQTLAAATGVTLVLLIVASIAGSFAWRRFEHQQFEFKKAELKREAEEQQAAEIRKTELRSSLNTANTIVRAQLDDGQFATAVSVLDREVATLSVDPDFADDCLELQNRADRLKRIAEFYRLAAKAQEANFLSQDESEIIATMKGLDLLGVWLAADWWNHLPDEDLNAEQRFQLREAIYRSLVLLGSTYTKLTGIRTLESVGGEIPATLGGRFDAIFSPGGKDEARATLAIVSMANRYRYAECLRWYHGVAGFRLLKARIEPARRLKPPRSSVDAYELAVLLLTHSLVPDFPFMGYRGMADDLMNARETFGVASQMAPDHYFTHLVLAQTEYFLGERAAESGDSDAWRHYEASQQAFGRCIALQPDLPFAYGDVSTVCLREYEVIGTTDSLAEDDVTRKREQLLERCMNFSLQALQRSPNAAWVHWHHGHALAAVGRVDDAMEAYRKAVSMSYRFTEDTNASVIDVDKIRGRARLISETQKRISQGDSRSVLHALIAAAFLMTKDIEEARPYALAGRTGDNVDPLAFAVSGSIALHDKELDLASQYFRSSRNLDPDSFWAVIGLAQCRERQGNYSAALKLFEEAKKLARTDYHLADTHLGQFRMLLRLGRSQDAVVHLQAARAAYPACHLDESLTLADAMQDVVVREALDNLRHLSTRDIVDNERITDTAHVFVDNGDFELPFGRVWRNPGAQAWQSQGAGESTAVVEPKTQSESAPQADAMTGNSALHIVSTPAEPAFRASTRQTITVDHDTAFRVSCLVRSSASGDGALRILVAEEGKDSETTVIEVSAQPADWHSVEGSFKSPVLRRNRGLMPMTLRIEAVGHVDMWIDDITIERVEESAGQP